MAPAIVFGGPFVCSSQQFHYPVFGFFVRFPLMSGVSQSMPYMITIILMVRHASTMTQIFRSVRVSTFSSMVHQTQYSFKDFTSLSDFYEKWNLFQHKSRKNKLFNQKGYEFPNARDYELKKMNYVQSQPRVDPCILKILLWEIQKKNKWFTNYSYIDSYKCENRVDYELWYLVIKHAEEWLYMNVN